MDFLQDLFCILLIKMLHHKNLIQSKNNYNVNDLYRDIKLLSYKILVILRHIVFGHTCECGKVLIKGLLLPLLFCI